MSRLKKLICSMLLGCTLPISVSFAAEGKTDLENYLELGGKIRPKIESTQVKFDASASARLSSYFTLKEINMLTFKTDSLIYYGAMYNPAAGASSYHAYNPQKSRTNMGF